ncbi:hypothetical protein [Streptomyces sp. 8K308]|uniref:hypothetical protein n=1 Tax=Streptomyces sp. 8K308 TaxID=2530388 RepID=UPI0014043CC3|nr:hypothetical protein [Streptomyces sp. 8K308]
MRKSIRLALPAVAAALALSLTACGEDEESNSNDAGNDNGASETTGGGEGEEAADDQAGGEAGGAGGSAPTAEQITGSWYVDLNNTSTSHNLDIFDGTVSFFEDMGGEGDTCDGTYADGTITLTECTVYGDEEWTDMSATVTWPGDGTIAVTWASGLTETYSNMLADMDLGELGDLGDMDLSELEDSLAELEELEAELGG